MSWPNTNNTPFGGGGTGGFGASNTTGGFGSPFGQQQQQQSGGFGSPSFGQPQGNTGFGGATQQQPLGGGGGFGASTSNPFGGGGGGGGFGQPQQQQQQSGGFGSTFGSPAPSGGLFGSSSTTTNTGFGATNTGTTGGGFGSTGFGAPAGNSSGTGLFGAPAPASNTGGLFGAPASSNTFGGASNAFGQSTQQTNTGFGGGGFGAQPSSFGAPAPSSNLFGQPAPAPNAFGAPAPSAFGQAPAPLGGSLFSAPAPAPIGGGNTLFGSPAPAMGGQVGAGGGPGTRATQFQPVGQADGNSSINLHSITAMPQYNNYSFEELRFQDYEQGVRGASATTPTASNTQGSSFGFASPAPAFGAAPAPTSLFGGPQAPAPSTGLFGSPSPAPAPTGFSSFGASAAPTAPFGGAPTTTMFGAPAPSTFGAPAPGAFGAPAPGPFTAPAPAPTTTFPSFGGSTATQAPFGSGAPASGMFGSTPAPAPTGGFSAFGQTPAPAPFGGGLFGSPAPAPGPASSLFGNQPAPAPSLFGSFGQQAPPPAQQFGAPFGQPQQPPAPGMFSPAPYGAPPQTVAPPPTPAIPVNANVIPPIANEVLQQQLRALENGRKELDKSAVWQGKDHGSSPSAGANLFNDGADILFSPSRYASFSPYKSGTPGSGIKIRPRGFPKTEPVKTNKNGLGIGFGRDNGSIYTPESHLRSAATTLVIDSEKLKNRPLRLSFNTRSTKEDIDQAPQDEPIAPTTPAANTAAATTASPAPAPFPATPAATNRTATTSQNASNDTLSLTDPRDYYQHILSTDDDVSTPPATMPKQRRISPLVPTLTKEGYTMSPASEKLTSMSDAELATVAKFCVAREGFGKIEWIGDVDVRGADLDEIVEICHGDISVYAKAEEYGRKPERGSKLNRPAVLTFSEMFPAETAANGKTQEEKVALFEKKLIKSTRKAGAEFVSYDASLGEWKIQVQHFSRYRLMDDSESETELEEETPRPIETPQIFRKAKSIVGRKGTPGKTSRIIAPTEFMEQSDDENIETDLDFYSDDAVMEMAEVTANKALAELYASVSKSQSPTILMRQVNFEEDGLSDNDFVKCMKPLIVTPTLEEIDEAKSSTSFFAKLASSISSSESPRRSLMGKSMRIGWHPDGSFLRPASSFQGGESVFLIKSRPILCTSDAFSDAMKPLLVQRECSVSSKSSQLGISFSSLPIMAESGAGSLSHTALESLALATKTKEASATFSVLAKLRRIDARSVNKDEKSHLPKEARRLFALSELLADLCSEEHASVATQVNDGAICQAVSSGDIVKASKLVSDRDYWELLECLCTSTTGDCLSQQLIALSDEGLIQLMSDKAIGILRLAALSRSESDHYLNKSCTDDWRQRLILMISQRPNLSMAELVGICESDFSAGSAALPAAVSSPHVGARGDSDRSVLYQLLRAIADPGCFPLSEVVKPTCWTSCAFDFSLSFHLSAVLTSLGLGSPLSPLQWEYISDSYKSQLLSRGCWPLAVLVELCTVGRQQPEVMAMKAGRAMDIVLRNYRSADDDHRLKDVLVLPEEWKDRAVALRAAYEGDVSELVMKLVTFDLPRAIVLFEAEFLPKIYSGNGMSRSSIAKIKHISETTGSDSLADALVLLETIRKEAVRLTSAGGTTQFSAPLKEVRKILMSPTSNSASNDRSTYAFMMHTDDIQRCSRSSVVKQALQQLEFVEKHLKAISLFGDEAV